MSIDDPELKQALQKLTNLEFVPQGFSKESSQVTIVRQNNTIIELLLSINRKLDQLITKTVKQDNIEEAITKLTSKVQNLKIGLNIEEKPVVKAPPRVFAVWTDPRKQVEEYRKTYGGSSYSSTTK